MFFEKHVASRCFAPPDASWRVEGSTKETVLHRRTQFYGVYEQHEGFFYNYATTNKQAEYDLVNGVRTQADKVRSWGA